MENDNIDNERTLKEGIVGGVLGACVGAPGLGVVFGIAHANKDKIKKTIKDSKFYF
jgi:hypothetical protein